jgi:hypothetical protein
MLNDRNREYDGHELRVNQCLPAVLFVKRLRAPNIFLLEEPRIRTRENLRTGAIPQKISALIPENRNEGQQRADPHDIQVACSAHHADREQQRIAGKKQAEQKPGLREYDTCKQRVAQPARQDLR